MSRALRPYQANCAIAAQRIGAMSEGLLWLAVVCTFGPGGWLLPTVPDPLSSDLTMFSIPSSRPGGPTTTTSGG